MSQENTKPQILTIEGSPDLSTVQPNDMVSFQGPNSSRAILFPAGTVLGEDRTSLHEAEDGATKRLDGAYITKLGGRVIGVSEPASDK